MEEKIINGIQQIGIGVTDLRKAWKWYMEFFGVDIKIFEDEAVAGLMTDYTGGISQKRHAALAMNLQGGGGFEIWQFVNRTPQKPDFNIKIGDLGIFAAKIKSKDIEKTYEYFESKNQNISKLVNDPGGNKYFYAIDPFNNIFQVVEGNNWFKNENKLTGAAYGAVIGVSDIEKSLSVYSEILNYDEVVYDKTGKFEDFESLPGGDGEFRRVLLKHSIERHGGFSRLFGPSLIELVQDNTRTPKKIFADRYWGDLGFIHLCFDIHGMELLKQECEQKGFPFTVDSYENDNGNSFDMGEAAGHFAYIEDPDGTLIEFVETHKVPIIKKIGWYFNLQKRNPRKVLPNWMVKSLSFNRIKEKYHINK